MWKRYPGINDLEFNAEGKVRWNSIKDNYYVLVDKYDGGKEKYFPDGYSKPFRHMSISKIIATLLVPNPENKKTSNVLMGVSLTGMPTT